MLVITYKIKQIVVLASYALASLLAGALIMLPSPAFAASPTTYAMACKPNAATAVAHGNNFVCQGGSAPNEGVYVAASGTDESKYPGGMVLTVVSVSCSKGKLNTFKSGDSSFSCSSHGKATVTVKKTIPVPGGGTGGISNCPANQGTCATCYSSDQSNCIDCSKTACSDSAVNCSAGNCDFVSTYIQPFITILSGLVGLIVVISLILGGIQYSASEGDPQKASKAKNRISNTIFAFIVYIFLYAFLQFLVPGGIFNR